jgi:hypothetical protein
MPFRQLQAQLSAEALALFRPAPSLSRRPSQPICICRGPLCNVRTQKPSQSPAATAAAATDAPAQARLTLEVAGEKEHALLERMGEAVYWAGATLERFYAQAQEDGRLVAGSGDRLLTLQMPSDGSRKGRFVELAPRGPAFVAGDAQSEDKTSSFTQPPSSSTNAAAVTLLHSSLFLTASAALILVH